MHRCRSTSVPRHCCRCVCRYDAGRELHLSASAPVPTLFAGLNQEGIAASVDDGYTEAAGGAGGMGRDGSAGMGDARGQGSEARPCEVTRGHGGEAVRMHMLGGGGSSSSWTSTWLADGSEWSATGRLGISLAALCGLQDAAFARQRAVSRLNEMCFAEWPPTAGPASMGLVSRGDSPCTAMYARDDSREEG